MATFIYPLLATTGRALLGLYFILPGIGKILGWDSTAALMAKKGMVLVPVSLALTIVLQIGGGLALALGLRTRLIAFVLAGLTLVISVVIHNFWTLAPGELQTAHELQNFVKNLAIMAGLLGYAGMGAGPWSLDARRGA
ncbi:DoxX family protein [Sphingorhabdus sp.]|uniref:DoxX family protein n=1 Tax=Sphingorhabdus sp. TaxID=1902408 RepID=UPI0037C66DD2